MENISEKICPKCQTANPIAANYCLHCGYEFQPAYLITRENGEDPLTEALRKKIIRLQAEGKEYHKQKNLWQKQVRNLSEKVNKLEAIKEEQQKEIRRLEERHRIEMYMIEHEQVNKVVAIKKEQQKEIQRLKRLPVLKKTKTVIIFFFTIIGSFFLGYAIAHSSNTSLLKEDLQIDTTTSHFSQRDKEFEKYVLIEAGTLQNYGYVYGMDEDKQNVEHIKLDSFYISKYDVIQCDYENLMGDNPSSQKNDSFPAMGMNFIDALKYCNKLSKTNGYDGFYSIKADSVLFNIHGNGYRLPTKYEYAFAARDRRENGYRYAAGNNLREIAWYAENCNGTIHKIAQKKCNESGLYDMVGNVYKYVWFNDNTSGINVWYAGGSYRLYSYSLYTFREYHVVGGGKYDDVGIRLVFVPRNMQCGNVQSKGWFKVRQQK